MKRLIIKQGDRVIRHELDDTPVTIGRDPTCDLFFSDQRLSRQHGRVTASDAGLRFEDLGSRNGSYVGGNRVDELDLKPGDEVQLGGLVLSFEEDAPKPDAGEDPTVMLDTGGGGDDDDATVMLPPPKPPNPVEAKTVMLSSLPPEHTPQLVEKVAAEPDAADQTMQLPSEPASKPASGLPKTRMLDRDALAASTAKGASDTMLLSQEPPIARPRPSSPSPRVEPAPTAEPGWMTSWPWSAKLILVVSSVGLLVYLTLAFPLVRTLGSALREESLRRGRALLSLAAASNGAAVGEGRIRDASVESVLREERVKDAFLLDLEGNVLAPSSRAGETLTAIDGIDAELADIRTFYLGRRGSDYVMVQPLLHRSRRVGLAVVVYEAATASGSWATAVLFLAFLVLLLGVVISLLLGKRMTLEPIASFRDDIEAVVKGDADSVPDTQGFAELSELAKSVNRMIARAVPMAASAPALAPATPPAPPKTQAPKSAPQPGAAPQTASKRPITAAVPAKLDADAARFWVDHNFIVVRADVEAAQLVGASANGMEGKHLIEAVTEQKLLEVILDAVNALDELEAAETTAELPGGGSVHVSATKDQGRTVVGLQRL